MGIFRILLAVAVILAHAGALNWLGMIDGATAVEAFFAISGFYITMILREKYVNMANPYWLFISNRFLKIFPLYWLVLLLTITCASLVPHFNEHAYAGSLTMYLQYGKDLSFSTWAYLLFNHIAIFFQEMALYMGVNLQTGNLFITKNFAATHPLLWRFELVPQAWSVGLELMFYVIAPFLVKKQWWVIALVALASFYLKFYGLTHGYNSDPFTYRFFPFELTYFLLGGLSFIFYKEFVRGAVIPKVVSVGIWAVLVSCTLFYSKIHFVYVHDFYLLLVTASMPFLFNYTKNFKTDRFIGELSYSVYLIHILVMNLLKTAGITEHLTEATIIGSIIASILMVNLIGTRIEKSRQARVTTSSQPAGPVMALPREVH